MTSQFASKMKAVVEAVHPHLKAAGFRKQRHTFNRETESGLIQVVNFQMGPFEPPGAPEIPPFRLDLYGLFTVNLGVFISEVHAITFPDKQPTFPKEYECEIRARLGELSERGKDAWWPLDARAHDLADEIWDRLQRHGLPFLNRFASRSVILADYHRRGESVFRPWASRPGLIIAVIHANRGEGRAAETVLTEYYETVIGRHPRHADFVAEVAEDLGIRLNR